MTIAVKVQDDLPFSLQLYTDSILSEFDSLGVTYRKFSSYDEIVNEKFDVLWHPFLAGLGLPESALYNRLEPIVITLHGVRPFIFLEEDFLCEESKKTLLTRKTEVLDEWHKLGRKLTKMIAVSNSAKDEILQTYGIEENKVDVIHHGVNHQIFTPPLTKYSSSLYFLSVAQYQKVKNIDRLVEAFLNANIPEYFCLHLHLPNFVASYDDDRIIITTEPLSEPELVILYQNAVGFLFPSIHESFGLPVLEAMACGSPVVASQYTSTAEICGDSAILVDPFDVKEMSQAIEQLTIDARLRERLSCSGINRAAKYSWTKSCKEHLQTFLKAINIKREREFSLNNPVPSV